MEMFLANRPPIHRLNHDILLHIFEQNAHMFADDNALMHTRTALQVCQSWRTLLLAMPFLWGKLLDFDALAHSPEYWWEELVRRTGDSVLWIKRRNPPVGKLANQTLALHLLKTVQDNFHRRLQILAVNLDSTEYVRSHALWNKISSLPAPQLQCFDLSVTSAQDGRRSLAHGYFSPPASFADNAPCLRKLWAATFEFNLQAPWVAGLRDLKIGQSTLLPEILDVLATIECLEYLELHDVWSTEDDKSLQNVHLRKLKELRFGSRHPSVCNVLFDHLTVPPDCGLQYTLTLSESWFDEENTDFEIGLTALIRRLSKYARAYFLHHVPTSLLFRCEDERLCIAAHAQDNFDGFHFQIDSPMEYSKDFMAAFLSEFTLPEFNHVTELHLDMALDDEDVPILPFLGCLSSVQVLTTYCWQPYFFKYLKEKLKSPRSVFSSLRTVKLRNPKHQAAGDNLLDYTCVDLSEFIDALHGCPVEVIISP